MKTKQLFVGVLGLGCVGLFFTAVSVAGGGAEKVELCHVPPGNPSAAHTITVSVKASESHLANHEGDTLGACPPTCGDGASCDDGDPCTADICLDSGFCDNSSPTDCDDGEQCTEDSCDPLTGCVNEYSCCPCFDEALILQLATECQGAPKYEEEEDCSHVFCVRWISWVCQTDEIWTLCDGSGNSGVHSTVLESTRACRNDGSGQCIPGTESYRCTANDHINSEPCLRPEITGQEFGACQALLSEAFGTD